MIADKGGEGGPEIPQITDFHNLNISDKVGILKAKNGKGRN